MVQHFTGNTGRAHAGMRRLRPGAGEGARLLHALQPSAGAAAPGDDLLRVCACAGPGTHYRGTRGRRALDPRPSAPMKHASSALRSPADHVSAHSHERDISRYISHLRASAAPSLRAAADAERRGFGCRREEGEGDAGALGLPWRLASSSLPSSCLTGRAPLRSPRSRCKCLRGPLRLPPGRDPPLAAAEGRPVAEAAGAGAEAATLMRRRLIRWTLRRIRMHRGVRVGAAAALCCCWHTQPSLYFLLCVMARKL